MSCCAFNEKCPHKLRHLNTWPQFEVLLRRFRKCVLAGRSVSLGVGFERTVFLLPVHSLCFVLAVDKWDLLSFSPPQHTPSSCPSHSVLSQQQKVTNTFVYRHLVVTNSSPHEYQGLETLKEGQALLWARHPHQVVAVVFDGQSLVLMGLLS